MMEKQTSSREVCSVKSCRVCGDGSLLTFLRLGPTPIPNGFLVRDQLDEPEKFYPLDVCFCARCGMVQLAHIVNAEVMFKNYLYVPSTSQTMYQHFAELVLQVIEKTELNKQDLVVDIGSNDGLLLKNFLSFGCKVLGIDPAENLAKRAAEEGVDTISAFFTQEVAERIIGEKGTAKIIFATNVMAHVPDLHDFLNGIKTLLDRDGIFVAEFPYLVDLMDKTEFDTIYQEHLSYFSLAPFISLLQQHDFGLVEAKQIASHGGSLRLTISPRNQNICQEAQDLVVIEKKRGFLQPETYLNFGKKVDRNRYALVQLLWRLREEGKSIVGYGASAKGNVMLNYCRIGRETLDYIVDSIPYKQGKFTPGTHIPIYPENKLTEDQPDYAFLLAWNFAEEILKKQDVYRQKGGKFIINIPTVKIT